MSNILTNKDINIKQEKVDPEIVMKLNAFNGQRIIKQEQQTPAKANMAGGAPQGNLNFAKDLKTNAAFACNTASVANIKIKTEKSEQPVITSKDYSAVGLKVFDVAPSSPLFKDSVQNTSALQNSEISTRIKTKKQLLDEQSKRLSRKRNAEENASRYARSVNCQKKYKQNLNNCKDSYHAIKIRIQNDFYSHQRCERSKSCPRNSLQTNSGRNMVHDNQHKENRHRRHETRYLRGRSRSYLRQRSKHSMSSDQQHKKLRYVGYDTRSKRSRSGSLSRMRSKNKMSHDKQHKEVRYRRHDRRSKRSRSRSYSRMRSKHRIRRDKQRKEDRYRRYDTKSIRSRSHSRRRSKHRISRDKQHKEVRYRRHDTSSKRSRSRSYSRMRSKHRISRDKQRKQDRYRSNPRSSKFSERNKCHFRQRKEAHLCRPSSPSRSHSRSRFKHGQRRDQQRKDQRYRRHDSRSFSRRFSCSSGVSKRVSKITDKTKALAKFPPSSGQQQRATEYNKELEQREALALLHALLEPVNTVKKAMAINASGKPTPTQVKQKLPLTSNNSIPKTGAAKLSSVLVYGSGAIGNTGARRVVSHRLKIMNQLEFDCFEIKALKMMLNAHRGANSCHTTGSTEVSVTRTPNEVSSASRLWTRRNTLTSP